MEKGKSAEGNDQGRQAIASQPVKNVIDIIEDSDSRSDIDIPLKPVLENPDNHLTAHAQSSDQKINMVDSVTLPKATRLVTRGQIHSKRAATELKDLDVPNLKARSFLCICPYYYI